MIQFRSIRTRLMLWNVGTLALVLFVLSLSVRYAVKSYLMDSIDRDLALRAFPMKEGAKRMALLKKLSKESANGPLPPMTPPLWDTSSDISRESDSNLLPHILDVHGKSLFSAPGSGVLDEGLFREAVRGAETFATRRIGSADIRILSLPIREGGSITGVVQMPYPLTETTLLRRSMDRTLLTLIPLALLLAGVGGTVLTDRALKPVRRIALTVDEIETSDLSRRLPVVGQDEFAHLANIVNGMLNRVQRGFDEQQTLVRALEEMVERQRRFIADASHELQTPIAIIQASSSLALQSPPEQINYVETLGEVNESSASMGRLVKDLLLLARADGEHLRRARVPVELEKVLAEAIRRVRRSEDSFISLERPVEVCDVAGDPDELLRVFSNLLENAVRYTPVEGAISVRMERRGERILVHVADSGMGIPAEHLPHLGKRFYRVDLARSRTDGGTGLGLAICKSILDAHDGSMSFESQVGVGTTVTVELAAGVTWDEGSC